MSKRIARPKRKKAEQKASKSKRQVVIICALLILILGVGLTAQWNMQLGMSKPLALSPAPTASLAASSPSKEYIYAGGRLIATEEPGASVTPTPIQNAATFVSQFVPSAMIAGQSYSLSLKMQNTGTSSWTTANQYRLGALNPQDNHTWTSNGRVELPSTISPSVQALFSFNVTAPSAPGSYNFQWKMVEDGVEWFGDTSPNVSINVVAARTPSTEDVVWTNASGVAVSGNSLSKTAGWGWGNSGASSTKAIEAGDGYIEYTVTDSTASISMLGLSNGDSNQDYPEIDYGIHPAGNGMLYIYENGVMQGEPTGVSQYAPGDKLRVSIEGGIIKYKRNGALIYTSAQAPNYPLRADAALYSPGAHTEGVVISGQLISVAGDTENVVWTNAIGVSVSGNSLSKTAGWGWGNSGASSTKAIASGDGYVEYTVTDAYASISMLGLSNGDANQDYTSIDYGIHPAGNANLYVYERGTLRGSFGSYAPGDKLRIAVQGGQVKYSKNGTVFYTSGVAPTYPLRADTAFYAPGSHVEGVVINGNLQSVLPTTENVSWTNAVGVYVDANSLSKTTGWGWGNSGASSTKAIASGDGYVEYVVADAYSSISLIGLSHTDTNQDYTTIDYGIHPAGNATLYVYESGTLRGSFVSYAPGDHLRVAIEGGVVKYSKNGVIFYTSGVVPSYPLRADTAFYSPGAHVEGVVIAGQLQ